MSALFLKDENITASPPILGYKILDLMIKKKLTRISIFDVAEHFKNKKWFGPKHLYLAMLFLFGLNLIDFQHSYIIRVTDDN